MLRHMLGPLLHSTASPVNWFREGSPLGVAKLVEKPTTDAGLALS
jgi:hypothetical protein